MGYDISVQFSSAQERDEMVDFLQQQDWSSLRIQGTELEWLKLERGENLGAYVPKDVAKSTLAGFHVSTTSPTISVLAAWMAKQSSHRNAKGQPVVFYDDEPFVVLTERQPNTDYILTDDRGIKQPSPSPPSMIAAIAHVLGNRQEKAARAWMEKVHQTWQEHRAHAQPKRAPSP